MPSYFKVYNYFLKRFDDLMEPCEEEKKRRALANQKIAEKMAITGNKPEQNEYP